MEQQVGGKQDVSRQHQVVTKQQALRPCCGMKM